MRILHIADSHLDHCYAQAGLPLHAAQRRREAQREVFQRVMDHAAAWPADVVLIAGDLFEQRYVSRETVAFLREAFEKLRPIPVFIAPGNWDPYSADSPYASEPWPANVFIYTEPAWHAHELGNLPLTVHGFACTGEEDMPNPFGELAIPEDGRVHVAVAHAAEEHHLPTGQKLFLPFDAAKDFPARLDYLALGHYHQPVELRNSPGPAWYPGAPEPWDFGHDGRVLEVTFTQSKSKTSVQVETKDLAHVRFETHSIDCSGMATAQQVLEAVGGKDAARKRVLQLTLQGECPASLRDTLLSFEDNPPEDIEQLLIQDETQSEIDMDASSGDATSLGLFLQRIGAELEDAKDEDRQAFLRRVREIGLAAYQGQDAPLRGVEQEAV